MAIVEVLNAPSVSAGVISRSDGTPVLDVANAPGVYVRRHIMEKDTVERSATTAWVLGPTFSLLTDFQAGSKLHLFYSIPLRNDSTSWGGGYIEPQISINGAAWESLGSCGYDGGVMGYGSRIVTYRNHILIDPAQASAFTAQFRFYFKSYDGTVLWNGNRDIELTSGTASVLPALITSFHAHIKVREIARVKS